MLNKGKPFMEEGITLEAYNRFKNLVDEVVQKFGDKTCIRYLKNDGSIVSFTFRDFFEICNNVRSELSRIGITSGERTAIITPHSPFGVIAGISLAYSNVTSVLIDASLPKEEIIRLLDSSDVTCIFTTAKLYAILPEKMKCNIPCFELSSTNTMVQRFPESGKASVAIADKEPDVISVIYSSGTTSQMKGIKVTYESVFYARDVFADLSGLKSGMSYLLVLPFNHISGFTGAMTFFLTGCELDFIEEFRSTKLEEAFHIFEPHYFAMVPKVYEIIQEKINAIVRDKGLFARVFFSCMLSISGFFRRIFGINIGKKIFGNVISAVFGRNISGIGTGALSCSASSAEFFLNLGMEWSNLYATTEAGVPIVATGIKDKYPVDTVGKADRYPDVINIKISNCDNNHIGEICVKSKMIMKGYFHDEQKTAEAFDEDGYFKTGDSGYIDRKGYLHITGRIKETIILKSGKKLSPVEIDKWYSNRIPGATIACCGVPNDHGTEELHLFTDTVSYIEKIKEAAKTAPSMYKPSEIHTVDRIPVTSVGKVKRYELTKMISEKGASYIHKQNNLIEIISKYTHEVNINNNSLLGNDLGIDSLAMFELVTEIEALYGVKIIDKLDNTHTVGDLEHLIDDGNLYSRSLDLKHYPVQKNTLMLKRLDRMCKIISMLYRVEVNGLENIPEHGNYLICSNHICNLDPLFILSAGKTIPRDRFACMAAQHTMKGIGRTLFNALGAIPVDRDGNTLPAFKRSCEVIESGNIFLIFPEGKRSRDGSMLPFKLGAAEMALYTGKSVLPVRIDGAFEVFPRNRKLPKIRFGSKKYVISISFGKSILPEGTSDELTREIRKSIEDL